MRTGRPKEPIVLSEEEREQLNGIANSRSLPHGLVRRAHIVSLAADGMPNHTIAERVDLSPQMVCKRRKRYLHQGLTGVPACVLIDPQLHSLNNSNGNTCATHGPMPAIHLDESYPLC